MKRSMFQTFSIIAAICLTSTVVAKDYVTIDANSAAKKGQTNSKLPDEKFYLNKIKENLNAFERDRALASLGTIYLYKKEYAKALKYLKRVGYSRKKDKQSPVISAASYNLGMIYIHGKGIAKNYPKAFGAFSRATWGGNVPAAKEVYVMCRDKEVAVKVIRRFTLENVKYYKQGKSHPLYATAGLNLNFLSKCASERKLIGGLLAKR